MILLTSYANRFANKDTGLFTKIFVKTNEELETDFYKVDVQIPDLKWALDQSKKNVVVVSHNSSIFKRVHANKLPDNVIVKGETPEGFYYLMKNLNSNPVVVSSSVYAHLADQTLYVYVNGFWNGFIEKTDANHIGFFERLFETTLLKKYELTTDLTRATVLLESVFARSLCRAKEWLYKIHFSGEPFSGYHADYDLYLGSEDNTGNKVSVPLSAVFLHSNNLLTELTMKRQRCDIPPKFCCFIVSNPNSEMRNKMFEYISMYKQVDSLGKYRNNTGCVIQYDYWTPEYRKVISQYKFIICFENTKKGTYVTEKLVNAYLAGTVPIYWGTEQSLEWFNPDSMIYLKGESHGDVMDVLNKLIKLDNDDTAYLKMLNAPVFVNSQFEAECSFSKWQARINQIL